ncbi:MAG: hypothetical protein KDN05_15470 [Verrucomicrobiae bacterium]|nr:hypothetical protein [Verrucomicrobiae bacterium]
MADIRATLALARAIACRLEAPLFRKLMAESESSAIPSIAMSNINIIVATKANP